MNIIVDWNLVLFYALLIKLGKLSFLCFMDQEEVIVQKTTNSRTEKTVANIQPFWPNRAVGLGNKGFVIWPEPNISLGDKAGDPYPIGPIQVANQKIKESLLPAFLQSQPKKVNIQYRMQTEI